MKVGAAKPFVFALALLPMLLLCWQAYNSNLGPNPVETITHTTGNWALRFLLISLTVTPARKLAGIPDLIKFRRMLGLFAFFYAVLHFLTWFVLDKSLDLRDLWADIAKRPYITAGSVAFASMIPLAITSTKGWIRRLGKKWQMLHRLAYLSAVAAVVHYYWLVKSDIRLPAMYAAIAAVLLGSRFFLMRAKRPVAASVSR